MSRISGVAWEEENPGIVWGRERDICTPYVALSEARMEYLREEADGDGSENGSRN